MRSFLIALCAFLLGFGAMAGWHALHALPPQGAQRTKVNAPAAIAPAPARSVASGDDNGPAPADSSALLPDQDWPHDAPTPEQVMYSQPDLLNKAIAQLKPRIPGKVNLYAVAFAGDGGESVFRNEAEYLQRLFASRFDAAGHVLVLENNPATLATHPLADWSNLETALDAVASRMDPRQDILLLYFTTHGSEDHTLLVDMDPLPLDQIGARDLPGILAEHPFRHRVVIVNACYSGGFIPPLRDRGTMIITAARADRSSFGCGSQSQLTWFGHAFLVDALNKTADFHQAFDDARAEVAAWETRDHYTPSDPQLYAGADIAAQLARWRAGFVPGAALPFTPAPASNAARPR